MELVESLAEALARASTILPEEVVQALRKARDEEEGPARVQLEAILKNVEMAKAGKLPICQDTGTPTFFVRFCVDFPKLEGLLEAIPEAVRRATKAVPLRPNTVHPFPERIRATTLAALFLP